MNSVVEFQSAITRALREQDFKKRRSSWYRETEDLIQVINLQKSQYGEQYYLNLGLYVKYIIKESVIERYPPEYKCHVRIRLAKETRVNGIEISSWFDLENLEIGEEERIGAINKIFSERVIPFMSQCASIEGIGMCFHRGELASALIYKDLSEALSRTN